MRIIELSDLHKRDFTVSSVLALTQHWKNERCYSYSNTPRPDNGLMLYISSYATYSFVEGGSKFELSPGDLLYMPKGSRYRAEFHCTQERKEHISNYLINFLLYDEDGEEASLSHNGLYLTQAKTENLTDSVSEIVSASKNASFPKAKLKAMMYNLLTDISLVAEKNQSGVCSFYDAPIKPALDYIAENYLSTIKVSELAGMCHMSDANFRRAFEKGVGVSPKEYITNLKLSCANTLLSRGGMSIAEVSRYIGIEDVSYFIRFYKKRLGVSPGKAHAK